MHREGASPRATRWPRSTSAAASSATWTGGDNVNLAVGQGDLQATPLQVAVAYSALANNGTIVKPHLGQGDRGRQRRHDAGAAATSRKRKIKIDPHDRAVVLDGLRRAATEERRHVR